MTWKISRRNMALRFSSQTKLYTEVYYFNLVYRWLSFCPDLVISAVMLIGCGHSLRPPTIIAKKEQKKRKNKINFAEAKCFRFPVSQYLKQIEA